MPARKSGTKKTGRKVTTKKSTEHVRKTETLEPKPDKTLNPPSQPMDIEPQVP